MALDGFHYHILRVPYDKQNGICNQLASRLPDNHGRVFMPMWEYYRRDRKCIEVKLMFTGYIFVHTDLKRSKLFDVCKSLAKPVRAVLGENNLWNTEQDHVFDLTEDEESFFDSVLDESGVERMSRGYIDETTGRALVTDGPLVEFSNHIVKLDKRNCLAWLDMRIGKEPVMAGLQIIAGDIGHSDAV